MNLKSPSLHSKFAHTSHFLKHQKNHPKISILNESN